MSMSTAGGSGLTNEPNVTPMIDVLMVLLIIFMVIVPSSRKALDVQLPDPTPAPASDLSWIGRLACSGRGASVPPAETPG